MGKELEKALLKRREMRKDIKRDFWREMTLDERRLIEKIMTKGYTKEK